MSTNQAGCRIGVLTSGGDASGMNAALRAIVRTGLVRGVDVFGIYEGFRGLIEGGEKIRPLAWADVGGIIHRGGTLIGSTRSQRFRTRDGRRMAARNLLAHDIDNLIVIGGEGSLAGADVFREEWPGLLGDLVAAGEARPELAALHPRLTVVGLVGSIDNDAFGTDMTIGADTALHRITEAVDAISSTASSHRRTFVVEVMGRQCGYLALMGALATGADWILIPEAPSPSGDWAAEMVDALKAGRSAGRRDAIVVLAEGATDRNGVPITRDKLREILSRGLGESARVTVLGHVQRGGAPSAFDRNLGTQMGYAAVDTLLSGAAEHESQVVGMRGNRVVRIPMTECVRQTQEINALMAAGHYARALEMRGAGFNTALGTFATLLKALPHPPGEQQSRLRIGILTAGAPAPGMNTAIRAGVRLAIDHGHAVFGVRRGFQGLIHDDVEEMKWMSVNGWAPMGGSELGTSRDVPGGPDLYRIAKTIEQRGLSALMVIGGWEGYQGVHRLFEERRNFPAFGIPMVCLPATIDNNLPGTELSIGADTALNNIVNVVDKIKQSAVAERRCYVVEVMGRRCGYLAMMSGLATGAERIYTHEEGVTLHRLESDLQRLVDGFRSGKRLGLVIRNEHANAVYDTAFMCKLFEEEGGQLFDVRQSILGHLQQGGNPSPFDRIQATKLATDCVRYLTDEGARGSAGAAFIGLAAGKVQFHPFEDYTRMIDAEHRRPRQQWWLDLRQINEIMARPAPSP
ncbi:MAG: 6-phosphofructokinase [Acidobacteriota bacterium]